MSLGSAMRHLLDTWFEGLRSALPANMWDTQYRHHWARLRALLEQNTTAEQRAGARERTTAEERDMIAHLMRRGLDA